MFAKPVRTVAAGFALLFAASGLLYFWLIGYEVWAVHPTGFYGYQTDAFLSGHLYLNFKPDPNLAELSDPYLGDQNRPYRVLDFSYYKGRYYSYFGVAPVVLLTLPWRLLTGTYLTEQGATAILALGTSALSLAFLWRFWRGNCPEAAPGELVAAGALVTLGNFSTILLGPINAGIVAQEGGYCCLVGAFLCLLRALERGSLRWLAGVSGLCALAVACRPNYLPAIILIVPAVYQGWRRGTGPFRITFAALAPFLAVVMGLLIYNYARFDSPWEFGSRLQLTDVDVRRSPYLSTRQIWPYLKAFAITPYHTGPYFPFFIDCNDLEPIGLIWACPASILSLGIVYCFRPRRPVLGPQAAAVTGAILAAFAGILLFLAAYRFRLFLFHYELDFFVPWMFVVAIGWMAARSRFGRTGWRGRTIGAIGCALCIWSIGGSLLLTTAMSPYRTKLPGLTRTMDALVDRINGWRSGAYGPVRLRVKFPASFSGPNLPLLTTGLDSGDLCYAKFGPDSTVQIGLFHAGAGGVLSEPVTIDPARPHDIDIFMGSLLPNSTDAFFDGWTAARIRRARGSFTVKLDGIMLLSCMSDYFDSTPASVRYGDNPRLADVAARNFSAGLLSVQRLPYSPDWLVPVVPIRTGAALVRFLLPPGRTDGNDPILSTGKAGRGDAVFVRYLPDGMVRFGIDHWGGAFFSPVVPADPGRPHTLVLVSNGLASKENSVDRFELVFDGRLLIFEKIRTYESAPEEVFWGVNAIGSSSCGTLFGGTILAVSAIPDPGPEAYPMPFALDRPGSVALTILFQDGFLGLHQPLVVTGDTGKADFLYLVIEDPKHARIGIDHWGAGGRTSDLIPFDAWAPHRLVIDFGSIHALENPRDARADRYQVRLDGTVVFSGNSKFYPTTLRRVFIGKNPLGGSTAGDRLEGDIQAFQVLP